MELPDKVLLKIFGYLSTKDILFKIAFVSKHCNLLTKDPNLIKKLDLNFDHEYDFEYIAKVLLQTRNLRQLKIYRKCYNSFDMEKEAMSLIQQTLNKNKNLKVLDLGQIRITITRAFMNSIYECGTNIEELMVLRFASPEILTMEPIYKLKHLRVLSVRCLTLNGLNIIANSQLELEKLDCQLVRSQSDSLEEPNQE